MNSSYSVKLKFKNRHFTVWIKPKVYDELGFLKLDSTAYDLEIETKGSLCGNDYVALREYLEDEGYIEAARDFLAL